MMLLLWRRLPSGVVVVRMGRYRRPHWLRGRRSVVAVITTTIPPWQGHGDLKTTEVYNPGSVGVVGLGEIGYLLYYRCRRNIPRSEMKKAGISAEVAGVERSGRRNALIANGTITTTMTTTTTDTHPRHRRIEMRLRRLTTTPAPATMRLPRQRRTTPRTIPGYPHHHSPSANPSSTTHHHHHRAFNA